MARNLWKVIQKQEKKIEELEKTIQELSLRVLCLESKNISKTPYKFDDHDWWKHQPIMSAKEIEETLKAIDLANKIDTKLEKDILFEFDNPIAKMFYRKED